MCEPAKWSRDVINAIDANLARLSAANFCVAPGRQARCGRSWRQRYGFSTDVVVSAGGGDNMMGAIGTGNVAPGVDHGELRHERHNLRVRRQTGGRSGRGDRGVLFFDRRMAAAAVHDECHDGDGAGARAVWIRS